MSNPLSVRRVMVQNIDEAGKPTFGVMAADGYGCIYNDTFKSVAALNLAIDEAVAAGGSILTVADHDRAAFPNADHGKIGTDNFYGKNWQVDLPQV